MEQLAPYYHVRWFVGTPVINIRIMVAKEAISRQFREKQEEKLQIPITPHGRLGAFLVPCTLRG